MVCAVLASLSATALGQDLQRPIPANAARAQMQVLAERSVTLNGTARRLSPGARIRDEENRIVLTQTLVQRGEFEARVLLDANGEVSQAWILTPGEQALDAPELE